MLILYDCEALGSRKNNDFMELVEIAGCKVDFQNGIPKIIDEFREIIKPVFHKQVGRKLSKIVHLTMEELKQGVDYDTALKRFVDWGGKDSVFISWGRDDDMIYENNYQLGVFDFPRLQYLDLQFIYDRKFHKEKRTGLRTALTERKLDFEGEPHTALNDAKNMLPLLELCQKEAFAHINHDKKRYF